MPPQLLASQFAAWEPLADDEDGLDYDVALEPDAIAEAAATALTGSTTGERHG